MVYLIAVCGALAVVAAGSGMLMRAAELSLDRALGEGKAAEKVHRRAKRERSARQSRRGFAQVEWLVRLTGSTTGIAAVLMPLLWWLTGNPVATVIAAPAMAAGMTTLRRQQEHRKYREAMLSQIGGMVMRVEQQLAAKSLAQAFTSLEGLPEPLATVMDPILSEIAETGRVGRGMRKLADAFPTPETVMLATVVEIAEISGGRVRENLSRIGAMIRRRLEMAQEVRAQTAEARNELRMILGMFVVLLVGGRLFLGKYVLQMMSSTLGAVFVLCTPLIVLLLVEWMLGMGQD